jgi:hypothetical protein
MKRIIIILVIASLFATCRSGEEELAVFDGGVVKRKEFREFYPNHELAIDNNTTALKYQTSVLETIAVQSIVEIESNKKGYSNTEIYKSILELKEKQLLVNLYRKNFIENGLKSKDMEIVSGQMLYVKKDANGNPNSVKADRAINDLQKLKSEKEINAYISKETDEEGRKPISGFLEPQCMNCSEENILREILLEAYKSNLLQTFTKKEFNGDLFVYRIVEVKKMKASDLESYLLKKFKEFQILAQEFKANAPDDQKQLGDYYLGDEVKLEKEAQMIRDRYKEQLQAQIWNEEYERISKASGIQFSKEMTTLSEGELIDATPIYTKGDKIYTMADLKKDYAKVNMKPNTYLPPVKELLYFFNSAILPVTLLAENPDVKNLKSSEKYESSLSLWKKNIAWSFFVRDLQESQIPVSEQELKDTYEAGKLYAYSNPSKSNPNKREPLPFDQVKDKIKEELRTAKIKTEMQKQIEKLKSDYHLQIRADKLKAGSV